MSLLAPLQLCRGLAVLLQTLSGCDRPGCCADAARCSLSSTPRILRRASNKFWNQLTFKTRIARPHSTASCTKSSAHSRLAAVRPTRGRPPGLARTASAACAGSSTLPPGSADASACGSLDSPLVPAARAAAGTRTAASPVPVPPAGLAAARPCAASGHDTCLPPATAPRMPPRTEGIRCLHLLDSGLPRYELQPLFRITDGSASLV